MSVTVIDATQGTVNGRQQSNPFSVSITATELPLPGVRLPYNPESFQIRGASNWQNRSTHLARQPKSDWINNNPRDFGFSITLKQLTERIPGVNIPIGLSPQAIYEQLERFRTVPVVALSRPSIVAINWGIADQFIGHIAAVDFNPLHFNPDGSVRVGDLRVDFTENRLGFFDNEIG